MTVAALARFRPDVGEIIAVAKYPHQRRLASELGRPGPSSPANCAGRCAAGPVRG